MLVGRVDPVRTQRLLDAGTWNSRRLTDDFAAVVADRADAFALADRRVTLSYAELDALVARAAAGLQALGVGPGDVVSWQLPNWHEAVVVHHAALRLGAVSNPIVPIYRHREVAYILGAAAPTVLVVPNTFRNFDYAAMAAEVVAASSGPAAPPAVVVVDSERSGTSTPAGHLGAVDWIDLLDVAPIAASTPVAADAVCLLLFTSGTTANPKGVLHTHQSLGAEVRSQVSLHGLTAADVAVMASPVSHMAGLLCAVLCPPAIGGGAVLQEIWDAAQFLRLTEQFRGTWTCGALPFLQGLTDEARSGGCDVSSLRLFVGGGSDIPTAVARRAHEVLGAAVVRSYGSTEVPTITGGVVTDPFAQRVGTDGRPIGDTVIELVDDDGRAVAAGSVGEVLVDAPETFVGYLDPVLDADSFDARGFFRTGDFAIRDSDGFLTVTGRKKDIIIRGGENISASEVEAVLYEHPAVDEAAVVGLPDPVLGERVHAFVTVHAGANVTPQDLVAHVRAARLARQKVPETVQILAELPKTASGKIQKFRLREIFG